jgi:murein hydrolase activator
VPRSSAGPAGALALAVLAVLPARAAAPPGADAFAAVRAQAIAAAAAAQQQERQAARLQHEIDLLGSDLAGRTRDLADSRVEQTRLLGALELLQRRPPGRTVFFRESPLDQARSELLVAGTLPVLRAEAAALAAEVERVAALRREIAGRRRKLAAADAALAADRGRLAALLGERLRLERAVLPEARGDAALAARLAHGAKDVGELIRRADAAAERRDRALLVRARAALPKAQRAALTAAAADPTRPAGLRPFDPPQSALVIPVSGTISQAFGSAATGGTASQGLRLAAPAGAEVVAPFDGRVVYAGPFGDLGLVLIMRHGDLYHSLLAGLGRVDARIGQWVLAGEPVGSMPDAPGRLLYMELRRDGRPVDPQPWLKPRELGSGKGHGD